MAADPTLNSTIGAALLGGFATSALYGIACSQCYSFFQSPHQRLRGAVVKYPIAALWILITLYTALVLQPLYWYAVTNFGNVSKVLDVTWSIRAAVILAAVNDLIVRSCFVHRAWILSDRKGWLVFPLILLILCLFGVTMTFGVWTFWFHSLQDFHSIDALYYVNLSMVVIVDLTIAGRLSFLLTHLRKKGVTQADSFLSILMTYTIGTGLVTSLVSTACLVTYAIMPNNYVFLSIFFPLSPLYVNSLLASYNAKNWLRPESIPAQSTPPGARLDGHVHIHFIQSEESC